MNRPRFFIADNPLYGPRPRVYNHAANMPSSASQDSGTERKSTIKQSLLIALALLGFCFLANYSLSGLFGVFEDDYLLFLNSQNWTFQAFSKYIHWAFRAAPQGRPLGWALNALVGFITNGDHLDAAYMIGLLILTANAFVLYLVVRRCLDEKAAFIGAVTYLVLPCDLSKMILMHRAFVHLSMSCLLLGLFLFVNQSARSKLLGYVVAGMTLLIWEGFYIPFLFAPLLESLPLKARLRRLVVHGLIWGLTVGAVLLIRYATGEDRVAAMASGGGGMLVRMAQAVMIGPLTGLGTFVLRPWDALVDATAAPKEYGFWCALLVGSVLFCIVSTNADTGASEIKAGIGWAFLGGLLAMVCPYVLMYRPGYFPPNITIGRLSCVHAPSGFGYSLLAAAVYAGVARGMRRSRNVLNVVAALYLGLLAVFSVHIQRSQYVQGWDYQKSVWKDIIALSADVEPQTTILVAIDGVPYSQMFGSLWLSGAAGVNFGRFVVLPKNWKTVPQVNAYYSWCEHVAKPDGMVLKSPSWSPQEWPIIRDGNFIFLQEINGRLVRKTEPVDLFGKMFFPKQPGPAPALQLTALGKRMIGDYDSANWRLLKDALPYPDESKVH